MNIADLIEKMNTGDRLALARCISIVENDSNGAHTILEKIKINEDVPVIGITGPPGAGKSTLVNSIAAHICTVQPDSRIAILAVDPTSPFTHGSLLGDRLRMTEHFGNANIFIRSIATRGALGGLSAKTIEIIDVIRAANFDYIFVETVGVGQSEVEIASLADTTVVVFVPESGDEIQTIKSGIMEIADLFVVNKADRGGADKLVKSLQTTLHERKFSGWEIPVLKTTASSKEGIKELFDALNAHRLSGKSSERKKNLLISKAFRLAEKYLIRKVDLDSFKKELTVESSKPGFNIYSFIAAHLS